MLCQTLERLRNFGLQIYWKNLLIFQEVGTYIRMKVNWDLLMGDLHLADILQPSQTLEYVLSDLQSDDVQFLFNSHITQVEAIN